MLESKIKAATIENLLPTPLVVRGTDPVESVESVLDCGTERKIIQNVIAEAGLDVQFRSCCATIQNVDKLMKDKATVVHFAAHGMEGGKGITFESTTAETIDVSTDDLSRYLHVSQIGEERIKIVVVSSCYSERCGAAFAKTKAAKHVVAVKNDQRIDDRRSEDFTRSFYRALLLGATVQQAFDNASASEQLEAPGSGSFVLLPPGEDHDVSYFGSSTSNRELASPGFSIAHGTTNYCEALLPEKDFVGRLSAMQQVYKYIVEGQRVVSVIGKMGIGKSTLVRRTASFLADRDKFDYIFYVPWEKMDRFSGLAPQSMSEDMLVAYAVECMRCMCAETGKTIEPGTEGLLNFLKTRRVLYVMDGCDSLQQHPASVMASASVSVSGSTPAGRIGTGNSPAGLFSHFPPPGNSPPSLLSQRTVSDISPSSAPASSVHSPTHPCTTPHALADLFDLLVKNTCHTSILLTSRTAPYLSHDITPKVVRLDPLVKYESATLLLRSLPGGWKVGSGQGSAIPGHGAGWKFLEPLCGHPAALREFATMHRDGDKFEVSDDADSTERYELAGRVYASEVSRGGTGMLGSVGEGDGRAAVGLPLLPISETTSRDLTRGTTERGSDRILGVAAQYLPQATIPMAVPIPDYDNHRSLTMAALPTASATATTASAYSNVRYEEARVSAEYALTPLLGGLNLSTVTSASEDLDHYISCWAALVSRYVPDGAGSGAQVCAPNNPAAVTATGPASDGTTGAVTSAVTSVVTTSTAATSVTMTVPWSALADELNQHMNNVLGATASTNSHHTHSHPPTMTTHPRTLSVADRQFLFSIIERENQGCFPRFLEPLPDSGEFAVTIHGYKCFLTWWLPVLQTMRKVRSEFLASASITSFLIHGFISSAGAEALLGGGINTSILEEGTFIIRLASGKAPSYPGQLAISYSGHPPSGVQHVLIHFIYSPTDGVWGPAIDLADGKRVRYRSLEELLTASPALKFVFPSERKDLVISAISGMNKTG